ncbi:MAG: hypothetical protein H6Q36_1746, partial [Chloroflexi bacterium]|nr:hypothetical protein [Chloroflexota bacterium]
FIPLRVIAWPLVGPVLDAPVAAVASFLLVVALAAWRLRAAGSPERAGVRWLVVVLATCTLLLAFVASGLASVTPLPVDHYHAFVDPATVLLVGIGAAALWRADTIARATAVVAVAMLVAWNLAHLPPAVAADGGWPAARVAGDRLAALAGGRPIALLGIPDFKPTTAYGYPLVRAGLEPVDPGHASVLAVLCDDTFTAVVGAPCGGPAEERAVAAVAGSWSLLERFSPAVGRTLSVYERDGGS